MTTLKRLVIGVVGVVGFGYMAGLIWVGVNVYRDDKVRSDVIVVLGAKAHKNGGYNPCLVGRVEHGVELYRQGYGKKIMFSGGVDHEDGAVEAEVMRKMAIEMGVKEEDILLEKESTSTWENLVKSEQVMMDEGLKSMVAVSEPFHMPRAGLVATKLGLEHRVSPAVESSCWQKWKFVSQYFLKEPLAIVYYWVKGRI